MGEKVAACKNGSVSKDNGDIQCEICFSPAETV